MTARSCPNESHPAPQAAARLARAARRIGCVLTMAAAWGAIAQAASAGAPAEKTMSEYVAMRFDPAENWRLTAEGNAGASALKGRTWRFDFTKGARTVGIVPPDVSLLGEPERITLRYRGDAGGRVLRVRLLTHFMVFQRRVKLPRGSGEHAVAFPAPPGAGWTWFGGENDGKIHGPLRLIGLDLAAGGAKTTGQIDLLDLRVRARCPADRACVLTAEARRTKAGRTFVGVIRSMAPKPIKAQAVCVVRDWAGKTLAMTRRAVTISADAPAEIIVAAPDQDLPFLEAVFTVRAPAQTIRPAAACHVAPLKARGSRKPDPASPFGMGVYLYRYPHTPQGLREMDRAAGLARAAGVKWSREEFNWHMIEPVKGKPDYAFYDRLVATAGRHGITLYGLLSYWSPWTKPYTKEGIADYCRYVERTVRRYKKQIQVWEVWNEPNIFFWQGPKDLYADLLRSAYAAIKKANPAARVAGCSTAGIDLKFIRRMLALKAPFDILTVHPYRAKLDDRQFVKDLAAAAKLVRRPDGTAREVWITEMGWGTHVSHNAVGNPFEDVTERQQAELLARTYVGALASGVCPNVSWYDFRCDGTNPLEWEHNLGILRRDFSPKPAYRAFATLTRCLAGKRFASALDLGGEVIAYRFTDPRGRRPVVVAWTVGAGRTVSVPIAAPAAATDLMGESTPLPSKAGAAAVRLRKGCPVFIAPAVGRPATK